MTGRVATRASSTALPSTHDPPLAAPAYNVKKYYVDHIGNMTWRTPSRMPSSVTMRLPPRRIGDDIRNHRIASEPSRWNTSLTSGQLRRDFDILRPSEPSTMPWLTHVLKLGRSKLAVASPCSV